MFMSQTIMIPVVGGSGFRLSFSMYIEVDLSCGTLT